MHCFLLLLLFTYFVISTHALSCTSTLFSKDPLLSGLSFPEGNPNGIYDNYVVYNAGTDIIFGVYNPPSNLTLGVEGGRLAAVVDLGTEQEFRNTYGIEPTVTMFAPYYTIHYDDNSNLVYGQSYTNGKLSWATFPSSITNQLNNVAYYTNFYPVAGHFILARITDTYDSKFERIVKLVIMSVESSEVTIRWDVLKDSEGMKSCASSNSGHSLDTSILASTQYYSTSNFFGGVPGWVIACTVILFVGFSVLVVLGILFYLKVKKAGYNALN